MSGHAPARALRLCLIDDEPPSRAALAALLAEHAPDAELHESDDAADVLARHATNPFDLCFVDVDLGAANGLVLAEQLLACRPAPLVVLATGSPHHATRGFELDVLDYLLKPFRTARVAESIARARRRLDGADVEPAGPIEGGSPGVSPPVGKLWAERATGARLLLDATAIDWARAVDGESRVSTAGEVLRVRLTFGSLAALLPEPGFLRVHRSWLVNVDRVREAVAWDSHSMTLVMGDEARTEIPVGRAYGERLRSIAGW